MNPETLDHAGIAQRVPHSGSMCLLQRMVGWSVERIACSAISHRDPANPLRTQGGLLAVSAIEYAAQAMALHGALNAEPGTAPHRACWPACAASPCTCRAWTMSPAA